MTLQALIRAGRAMVPAGFRGPVTLTDPATGQTTTAQAIVVPATASPSDSLADRQTIRTRQRAFTLFAAGLAFPPTAGMKVTWGGLDWLILPGVSPLDPAGTGSPALYRGVMQR